MAAPFYDYRSNQGGRREGLGRWGTAEDLARFRSNKKRRNIRLAEGVDESFYREDVDPESWRNNHVLVVGGSGSGKTRYYSYANLIGGPDCNYVVTDPKGELYRLTADSFRRRGYRVYTINTVEPSKSDGFDPLQYVQNVEDVATFAEMFATIGLKGKETYNDYYWPMNKRKMIDALLRASFGSECVDGVFSPGAGDGKGLHKHLCMDEFLKLLPLTQQVEIDDRDGMNNVPFSSFVDRLSAYEKKAGVGGEAGSVEEAWSTFRSMPAKTYSCVVSDVAAALRPLSTPEVREIYRREGVRLDKFDEGKNVLFIIKSDNDSSHDALAAIVVRILLNQLQRKADSNENGMLKTPVRLMLDEFANLGKIADFDRIISTGRGRGISCDIILQTIDQLDAIYEKSAMTIVSNCDTFVYMGGGSSVATNRFVSDLCGQVDRKDSSSLGEKAIVTPSEVDLLRRDECIVKISGAKPIKAKKLDLF